MGADNWTRPKHEQPRHSILDLEFCNRPEPRLTSSPWLFFLNLAPTLQFSCVSTSDLEDHGFLPVRPASSF